MTGELRLGDLADIESGYAFKSSDWVTQGNPVVKIKNVKDGYVSLEDCGFVSDQIASKASRFIARGGDVLVSLTGYVGQVGRVEKGDTALVNQRVGLVRPVDESEKSFVYHLFRNLRTEIEELATGTAQANVAPRDIMNLNIENLGQRARKKIGEVLDFFDFKIGVNTRISKTLEDLAQTIFKSWFIDFDPVKAKMAGEKPVGVDDATAALFPDLMEDSELGPIPKGWSVQEFGEANHLLMGQSPPGDTYNSIGEGVPFYQGRTDFGMRFPKQRVFCTAGTRFAKAGEVLISVRAPVGDLNQAIEDCVIGRGVASAMHKSGGQAYSYALLCSLKPRLAYYNGEGTVFGAINRSDFSLLKVVEAPRQIVDSFETVAGPLNDEIRNLFIQTEILIELRDSFMPRLISGELQIPEEMLVAS